MGLMLIDVGFSDGNGNDLIHQYVFLFYVIKG